MKTFFYISIMAVVLLGSKGEDEDRGDLFGRLPMGLDLRMKSFAADAPPEIKYKVNYPSSTNIKNTRVALINGFTLGTSMMALATVGAQARPKYPQMDILSGEFYTNVYRWALRALSLIPDWLGGSASTYPDSQKVWRRRFYYMENEVPQWLRSILFFVKDWDLEEDMKKRYNLYAKPAFDKHMRYPSKVFKGIEEFDSFRDTRETVENLDDSEAETVAPRKLNWLPKKNTQKPFIPHVDP